jgi:hypothetical protein
LRQSEERIGDERGQEALRKEEGKKQVLKRPGERY